MPDETRVEVGNAGFWDGHFAREDPWSYSDTYEVTKRAHTLELLPDVPIARALELGCAEGHFTVTLKDRVARLLAMDISGVALNRARQKCTDDPRVSFVAGNFFQQFPDGVFDLIFCSEILYYAADRFELEKFIRELERHLAPGGYLLLAHAYLVTDDRTRTGFDFNEIGGAFIAGRFARRKTLTFLRELRTELYAVQLFQKTKKSGASTPRELLVRRAALGPSDHAAPYVKWGGCAVTAAEAQHLWASPRIPILMYHRIAADGPPDLAPWRLHPAQFERQLAYLQRHGYRGIGLQEAHDLVNTGKNPAGRLVVLTFDDAYLDFHTTALPLLERYGFSATVFVPVEHVGGHAEWDRDYGPPAPLMSWEQMIAAQSHGIVFGSHTLSHKRLTGLAADQLRAEITQSRALLAERLERPVPLFCYPYGDETAAVRAETAAAGYSLAVTTAPGWAAAGADPFGLPRQEILGDTNIDNFIALLGNPVPQDGAARWRYRWLRFKRDRRTYMPS